AVAAQAVVVACLDRLSSAVSTLSEKEVSALCLSSSRLGASGLGRRLEPAVLQLAAGYPTPTTLLVAHHVTDVSCLDELRSIGDQQLAEMGAFGAAGWPGLRALSARMLTRPSATLLDAIRAHGHDAAVPMEQLPPSMPDDLLQSILRDAADFPLAWL